MDFNKRIDQIDEYYHRVLDSNNIFYSFTPPIKLTATK